MKKSSWPKFVESLLESAQKIFLSLIFIYSKFTLECHLNLVTNLFHAIKQSSDLGLLEI